MRKGQGKWGRRTSLSEEKTDTDCENHLKIVGVSPQKRGKISSPTLQEEQGTRKVLSPITHWGPKKE